MYLSKSNMFYESGEMQLSLINTPINLSIVLTNTHFDSLEYCAMQELFQHKIEANTEMNESNWCRFNIFLKLWNGKYWSEFALNTSMLTLIWKLGKFWWKKKLDRNLKCFWKNRGWTIAGTSDACILHEFTCNLFALKK